MGRSEINEGHPQTPNRRTPAPPNVPAYRGSSLRFCSVLITLALARRPDISAPPLWVAHLPWMTFALMIGTVVLFFSALKAAGVDVSGQSGPLKELPAGVSGYVGWANRAFFATTYLWAVLTSIAVIQSTAR
jgi:hypothetical protein